MAAGFEPAGIRNKRLDGRGRDRTEARYRGQTPHILVAPCPGDNRPFEFVDLLDQRLDLIGEP